MLFPSIEFALFFALVFPVTWLLNSQNALKKSFLVVASCVFYAAWNKNYVLLLLGSGTANYCLALALGRLQTKPARLAVLWLAIVGNLGLLCYFKYYNFFAATAMNVLNPVGVHVEIGFVELALPVAISFLTFHALSYIIDVYHRRLAPTRSLVDILLYISFFPHLVAGPIVRARDFLAQTARVSDPCKIKVGESVFLIMGGLFKKVIIANYLSTDFVDPIFQDPHAFSRIDLLLGMYAYGLQIYCDFSAYTDIAIGIANLLGYQFPQNFNQPYRAVSVQDFWRRWHMTLSSWLRDYLYIPLGGSRGTRVETYRNLILTMGFGGLWHGANMTFVIWGLMHGAALVVERMLGIPAEGSSGLTWRRALMWLVTFQFVCVTWVFFRSPTLDGAIDYFQSLIGNPGWGTTMSPLVALVFVLAALTQVMSLNWYAGLERRYDQAPIVVKVAIPFAVMLLIAVAAPSGIPPFIYFQF